MATAARGTSTATNVTGECRFIAPPLESERTPASNPMEGCADVSSRSQTNVSNVAIKCLGRLEPMGPE